MPKRSAEWSDGFSSKLINDESYRRELFFAMIDEGLSWRQALKQIVKTIGLKEYSKLSGFQSPNLLSQLSDDKDIRLSTLEKMIKPLGIELNFLPRAS